MTGLYRRGKPLFLFFAAVLSLKAAVPAIHAGGRADTAPSPAAVREPEDPGRHLERILGEGRRFLNAGEYTAAMNRYAEGLEEYRAGFLPASGRSGNEHRILLDPAPIIEGAKRFPGMAVRLTELTLAVEKLSREPEAPVSRAFDLYEAFLAEMEPLDSFRNILSSAADAVSGQLAGPRETDPARGDPSFLFFAGQLISGPPGEGNREGMIGAVDGLGEQVMSHFAASLALINRRSGAGDSALIPAGEQEPYFRESGTGWETGLSRLEAEAAPLEYKALLQEFKSLLTNVRETYFNGNFERAEELLVRARDRYQVIHNGEDAELTYWLALVRGVRSLRAGRVIPITAPLYAEMSQLLSDAKKSYDEGMRFLDSDRQSAGLVKLTEARQKTQEVKLLFPVNQEANFLELRIDRITDPAAFDRSFRRHLAEAAAGTKARSLQAFVDLHSLASIDPQYPGIQDMLEQAEKDMGYRPLPSNPRDLAQSDKLTLEAQNMVYGRNQDQYPLALEKLNQALRLNPYNNQAVALKERLQTTLEGMEAAVLDSGAERDYQRAVLALQQGNPITALSILRELLRDPRYRNTAKIIALQRRIESVL
jgi:tetratricopeptide (TPR) repeat protein